MIRTGKSMDLQPQPPRGSATPTPAPPAAGETAELTIMELEERIAPRLSSNHNETMLRG